MMRNGIVIGLKRCAETATGGQDEIREASVGFKSQFATFSSDLV